MLAASVISNVFSLSPVISTVKLAFEPSSAVTLSTASVGLSSSGIKSPSSPSVVPSSTIVAVPVASVSTIGAEAVSVNVSSPS